MNNKPNIAVLCDGISCSQISLIRAGMPDYNIVVVEYDKKCQRLVKTRFPNTIQRSKVEDVTGESLCEDLGSKIDLLLISAPCQDISVNGKGRGIATDAGEHIYTYEEYEYYKRMGCTFTRSSVFMECVRIKRELEVINPEMGVFSENVVSNLWEPIMAAALGCNPQRINSFDFGVPQNRLRSYLTNFPILPYDAVNTILGDVIPGADTGAGWHGVYDKLLKSYIQTLSLLKKGYMAECITTFIGNEKWPGTKFYSDGVDILPFTIADLERLQRLPVGYTYLPGLTDKDRIKMIGNCWTIPVIVHILKSFIYQCSYSY